MARIAPDGVTDRDWETGATGRLRLALAGVGWWTRDVALPAVAASDYCEATVLVSGSPDTAASVAAEYGATAVSYEEFEEGAAAAEYDAVYVATPNAAHLGVAEAAAARGKAVLCEKPMEASVERAERLVEACAGVPLMVAYRMQTDPLVRRARELVRDGFIGEPVHAYGTNSQRLLELIPEPDQWRLDPELTGYGTSVMDLGIYPINTVRFLLDRDPVAVAGHCASPTEAFADVPDERAAFLLRLEADVQVACTASQNAQADTALAVTGTEGQIRLQPAFHGRCVLHLARGEETTTLEHEGLDERAEMREEFDYFADRVLGDAPIGPDGEHGLVDMRTIAAIHEAAEAGGWVTL